MNSELGTIVKMVKKTLLVLTVLAVLMEVKGHPVNEAEKSVDPDTSEHLRFFPKPNWLNFHEKEWLESLLGMSQPENMETPMAELLNLMMDDIVEMQTATMKKLGQMAVMSVRSDLVNNYEKSVNPETPVGLRFFSKPNWLNSNNKGSLPSLFSGTNVSNMKETESLSSPFSGMNYFNMNNKGLMGLFARIRALKHSQEAILKKLTGLTRDKESISLMCDNKITTPDSLVPEPHVERTLSAKPANNGKENLKVTEKPALTENPIPPEFVKPDSPNDEKKGDKYSAIKDVLVETTTKK